MVSFRNATIGQRLIWISALASTGRTGVGCSTQTFKDWASIDDPRRLR
jgi:hypothetical protein